MQRQGGVAMKRDYRSRLFLIEKNRLGKTASEVCVLQMYATALLASSFFGCCGAQELSEFLLRLTGLSMVSNAAVRQARRACISRRPLNRAAIWLMRSRFCLRLGEGFQKRMRFRSDICPPYRPQEICHLSSPQNYQLHPGSPRNFFGE